MKTILIIALLFISALAAKADDYYDIPVGWVKVVEFDSTNNISIFLAENNKIIYYNAVVDSLMRGWFFSNDFGKKFIKFYLRPSSDLRKSFIYKGKLCFFDNTNGGFHLFRFDIDTQTTDSIKVTEPVGGGISGV